jgi:dipeptidyl aminopeptidase/acylaminoacyl peptidase
VVHANIYPPRYPLATADGPTPYALWAYGSPTSHARMVLDLELSYFTSRGIGVADVNYGGSTYYGRVHRIRLRELLDLAEWNGEKGTHDFASRYMDSLIGPRAEVPDRHRERSPARRGDRITVPFPLLQGLDDPICPPVQCGRFPAVAGHGIPHACLTFARESHGFRRLDTLVACLEAQLALHGQVFGFTAPGVPALELTT